MTSTKEKIGENIELIIEGLPEAVATPAHYAKIAMNLAKYNIPLGADLTAGVLGGIRYATLRIGREYYRFKYSIVVLRPITALEVFSEAIAWIEFKKARGAVDAQLADEAIDYLRKRFRNEFR